jgi:predicted exporter
VIFVVAYRQVWRPFKAALCLLLGLGYSLGFATLAIGHLNILTITFAPMLIGRGHGLRHPFHQPVRGGNAQPPPGDRGHVERATALTGQGIVTGGVTMAAAFLAMALTDFRGIREMGIIAGCGVLLCLIPMMTCLPLLLRRGRQNLLDHHMGPTHQRRLEIELLWLRHPALVRGGHPPAVRRGRDPISPRPLRLRLAPPAKPGAAVGHLREDVDRGHRH